MLLHEIGENHGIRVVKQPIFLQFGLAQGEH